MALAYSFAIEQQLPVEATAEIVLAAGRGRGILDADVDIELLMDDGVRAANGTWMRVVRVVPSHSDIVLDELGFETNVRLVFRIDRSRDFDDVRIDYGTQRLDMVAVVATVLKQVSGSAVLHWEFEQVWLVRKDGMLSLSERDDLWTPERLALVPRPYARSTFSFD